jgi:tetratricopeptide (TPR) repeat protein
MPLAASTIAILLCPLLSPAVASAQELPTPSTTTSDDAVSVGFEHERAEARERLRTARELFERGNFDASLAEFRRLYDLLRGSPQQPRVLYNMAQCQEQLGRYDEAIATYRQYLREMGDAAPNRTEVEATLRTLDGLLGTLRLTTNVPGAEVWIDDRRVGTAPGDLRVAGGRHTVQLRATGHLPAQADVQLTGRSIRSIRLTLERIPQSRGLRPAYFWSAVAATGLTVSVGAAFGGLALSANGDAADRLNGPERFTVTAATRSDIESRVLVADVLFGTSVAFAIGTAVLGLLTDFRGRSAPRTARWSVAPLVASGSGRGVALGASF